MEVDWFGSLEYYKDSCGYNSLHQLRHTSLEVVENFTEKVSEPSVGFSLLQCKWILKH